jgi:tRNA threonylcarbamoyladenosine biosynthesis protein TsaB
LDTTGSKTSVALAEMGNLLGLEEEEFPNSHAQKITILIQKVLAESGKSLKSIQAVAINSGPGSYTGLRIGSTTAKGLCLGLQIPLISINGLEAMTYGILHRGGLKQKFEQYCPILDARRMEVFTAVYDSELKVLLPSTSKLVDQDSFFKGIAKSILFFGTGAKKVQEYLGPNPLTCYDLEFSNSSQDLCFLGYQAYLNQKFENLIDFEPFYLKEFFSPNFRE